MNVKKKRIIYIILFVITSCLLIAYFINKASYAMEDATIVFSNTGIDSTASSSGYSIDGTTLNIIATGTYRITGSCEEGSIVVAKSLSGVTLILDNLNLTSSNTAPIVVKKSSTVKLNLAGENTLTDNEDASTEETNADFEGAGIKVKSGASLIINGDGTLNVYGNAKNSIKGSSESNFTINSGTINIVSVNNGIAFDGNITINSGTINITSGNDGIKSVPDEEDTTSSGTIDINGGNITINSTGDGIQAGTDLTISNGIFYIKTLNGYNSSNFDSDTMSCKGLKASGNDTDTDTDNATNTITITGGTFNLNTADDAIHSDGYVIITGGTIDIRTGDDGVHADTSLTLGTENRYERDPEINIYSSYEGLEAGTIYAYSGKYYVVASDDGINAAGGSSNGTDRGFGGGNHFNPRTGRESTNNNSISSSNYAINIYGGKIYVDCKGDGIDSNGNLNLYGGEITVFSQATGGDNSPLDSDGTLLIKGATVFAAGTNPMNETPSSSSQYYYTSTTSRSTDTIVNVSINNSVVYSDKLLRNVNYILYSSPSMTSSSASVSTASSLNACKSNSWNKTWDSGVITTAATETTTGTMTYTSSDCSEIELKTIPKLISIDDAEEDNTDNPENVGYTVTFNTDSHASVNIYYTQDYSSINENNVNSTISRNSDTGKADSSGNGQINYAIAVDEGYEIESITISGTYKNNKNITGQEIDNLYRITKISSDLIITITTIKSDYNLSVARDGNKIMVSIANKHIFTYEKLLENLDTSTETITITDVNGNVITDSSSAVGTGSKVTIDNYEYTVIIYGDIDGNGIVNISDAEELAKIIIDKSNIEEEYFLAGDLNHNGIIKMNDVMLIIKE